MSEKPGFMALQQAENWYAEIEDITSPDDYPAAMQRWLNASEENRLAWQYVLDISQRFASLRENDAQQMASLTALTQRSHNTRRRQLLKAIAGLSVTAAMSAGCWQFTPVRNQIQAWRADFHSPHGKITAFRLTDGSRIWLDTDSALNVIYTSTARRLQLLNGRIMIETAPDSQRPLTLITPEGQMRALGTGFSAQINDQTTTMLVYQGAVEVSLPDSSDSQIVQAGEAIIFSEHALGAVSRLHTRVPDWRRGVLEAENLSLGVLIKRLSAYRWGYLGCDPAVALLSVTGTFPLNDTTLALTMITYVLPVRIQHRLP
ncbi:MAG: Protein FecR [Candidatus Erwinia impunctatus]|nr:Protein FecR [Culicoides impunctatus]